MPAAFIQTENIDLAAAFRVLGFPIRTDKTQEEISGQSWTKILIGSHNLPQNAFCPVGQLEASSLRKSLMDREHPLWRADPNHPLIEVLAVFQNRQSLLTAMLKGTAVRLDENQLLVAGEESPAVRSAPSQIKTGDYRLAAALTRLGYRIARIEGTSPNCKIYLDDPKQAGQQLVRLYREAALDERNPIHVRLGFLAIALEVRHEVLAYVQKRESRILLINPRRRFAVNPLSSPSALIPASADNRTLDSVRKHLRIGG